MAPNTTLPHGNENDDVSCDDQGQIPCTVWIFRGLRAWSIDEEIQSFLRTRSSLSVGDRHLGASHRHSNGSLTFPLSRATRRAKIAALILVKFTHQTAAVPALSGPSTLVPAAVHISPFCLLIERHLLSKYLLTVLAADIPLDATGKCPLILYSSPLDTPPIVSMNHV
jgi:hypothetical protein